MKKELLLALAMVIFVFSNISGQPVLNGGFEEWDAFPTYMDPTYWDSPNTETSLVNKYTVFQESGLVYEGNYSAKLLTSLVLVKIVPGLLTLGEFSVNFATMEFTIKGGVPFNSRPENLIGMYQFTPVNSDVMSVLVVFTLWNSSTNQSDTIGTGFFSSAASQTEWTQFSAPITFITSDYPDTMNIVIMSSRPDLAQAGTTLYIDKLAFDEWVGMPFTAMDEPITLFHNIEQSLLQIDMLVMDTDPYVFTLYNSTGQIIRQEILEGPAGRVHFVPLGGLKKGLYVAEIRNDLYRQARKIII